MGKRKATQRKLTVNTVLLIVAVGALTSFSSGFLSRPAQTVYFTQSITTLSTWITTNQYPMGNYTITTVETWGQVCGNVPWDMQNITAHCSNEPVPEFPAAPVVIMAASALVAILLRRRRR